MAKVVSGEIDDHFESHRRAEKQRAAVPLECAEDFSSVEFVMQHDATPGHGTTPRCQAVPLGPASSFVGESIISSGWRSSLTDWLSGTSGLYACSFDGLTIHQSGSPVKYR